MGGALRGTGTAALLALYQLQPPLFAEICLPERFTVLDIAGGSVLGVLSDEYDVERVARYRLVR